MILWHNTEENWESIFRGIKKTGVKFVIATAFIVSPHQPWLTLNLILITLAFSSMTFFLRKTEQRVDILRGNEFYEKCVEECLKENILHHIRITRFFNIFQYVTSTVFGVLIGVSMMVLASLSIVLTKAELFSFIFIKFAFIFFVELVVVFGYCLMGTFLTDEGDVGEHR
ncbi:uncharacterized protein LOC120353428 [Nilaparvata lugens]|uniref:uncharacterized protein LOC120353428 n=1 Tax=Nilaparvata lugens TaxID=108931 RepID=UPI00193D3D84|nr:uncharacterized protein LOC120353428 [Nilaparvata lugens]